MQFVVPEITFSVIISLVLGAFLLIQGVAQLITGKVFDKSYANYTPESVKKFARPSGICLAIIGLALIAQHFVVYGENDMSWAITLGIAGVFIVLLIILSFTILKKKAK